MKWVWRSRQSRIYITNHPHTSVNNNNNKKSFLMCSRDNISFYNCLVVRDFIHKEEFFEKKATNERDEWVSVCIFIILIHLVTFHSIPHSKSTKRRNTIFRLVDWGVYHYPRHWDWDNPPLVDILPHTLFLQTTNFRVL